MRILVLPKKKLQNEDLAKIQQMVHCQRVVKKEFLNMNAKQILELEAKGCFDFFWNEANNDPNSPGYGLIRDNDVTQKMASIASVGYGLSAIVIGVERGWITREQGEERVLGTLATFWNNAEHIEGFFYHFLDMDTALKFEANYDCASIIDTAIFINGAITAAEYFGGEIAEITKAIYERINWSVYHDVENNYFYMGYHEGTGGFGAWDMYAEQLMQYILGIGSPTNPVPAKIYDGFIRDLVTYDDYEFYDSPGGPLFIHQFSHAWYDFENTVDKDGVNWFDNSVKATLAQRQYSKDNPRGFKTYSEKSWGANACQGPFGYRAYGTPPFSRGHADEQDGTVAPAAPAASIIFTPKESIEALEYFYNEVPQLRSKYGFLSSYNLDVEQETGHKVWVADRVIGIEKGPTLMMIDSYQNDKFIQKLYMQNEFVKRGAELIGFKKV